MARSKVSRCWDTFDRIERMTGRMTRDLSIDPRKPERQSCERRRRPPTRTSDRSRARRAARRQANRGSPEGDDDPDPHDAKRGAVRPRIGSGAGR